MKKLSIRTLNPFQNTTQQPNNKPFNPLRCEMQFQSHQLLDFLNVL